MRVIAGINKGRTLFTPPGLVTRPTSARVKEALFSILTSRFDFSDISVLDICAGTGSLGIEALSRGATSCCFIESNRPVTDILRKNIEITGNQDCSQIIVMDAVKALKKLTLANKKFDLAFFDPPYSSELYDSVPELLDSLAILKNGAFFVAECSVRNMLADSYRFLKRFDRRVYGETSIDLFIVEEN